MKSIYVFAFFSLACATVSAQCTIDQNQPQWDGGTSERNLPGYYDWQSFTAGMSGSLCEVDVMFCNSGATISGSGILNIYDGTGIGGTLLSSDTVNVDGSAYGINSPFWQPFMPDTAPAVVTGQIYTWQFIPIQGGGLPDPYLIQVYLPDIYAGGVSYGFGNGGDITFATYVDVSLGINAVHENGFAVYPNPAQNEIFINGNPGDAYMIYNAVGEIVLQGKSDNRSEAIDIHTLSPGIYFVKCGNALAKFIKAQ